MTRELCKKDMIDELGQAIADYVEMRIKEDFDSYIAENILCDGVREDLVDLYVEEFFKQ